ncbi:putative site-specific integrase-resolvase [Neobacillus niacini]|uniref:hypothetical protein n=1 Tax=Neobacillus niacini TaxID=86668 RepID=UPI002787C566|nr:hypothetical protein [Neobacillus niacini]MDQ1003278.1 putative site-specific integrase-resolvase [Neobacillus niacini]
MNTDQAYELLTAAGVNEEISIQTVRRWLRERKIKYVGTFPRNSGYILDDTDEALNLLKDAGVSDRIGIQIVRRWLREGKIQNVGKGRSEYLPNETLSEMYLNNDTDQEKIIGQLKVKINTQDELIKGMEQLHKTSIGTLIQQRENLSKEIINLEHENSDLQKETKKLLKENIELRNQLLELKEELSKGNKKEPDKVPETIPSKMNDIRRKLGLSKTASHKEVFSGYKKLLKVTHPDQGGNASAFHYIKTDYDYFRNSIKE